MKLTNLLNELVGTAYPFEKDQERTRGDSYVAYKFISKSKKQFIVVFRQHTSYTIPGWTTKTENKSYERTFSWEGSYGNFSVDETGDNDAIKVARTVAEITAQFLRDYQPDYIVCSHIKTKKERANAMTQFREVGGRAKLSRSFLEPILPSGYTYKFSNGDSVIEKTKPMNEIEIHGDSYSFISNRDYDGTVIYKFLSKDDIEYLVKFTPSTYDSDSFERTFETNSEGQRPFDATGKNDALMVFRTVSMITVNFIQKYKPNEIIIDHMYMANEPFIGVADRLRKHLTNPPNKRARFSNMFLIPILPHNYEAKTVENITYIRELPDQIKEDLNDDLEKPAFEIPVELPMKIKKSLKLGFMKKLGSGTLGSAYEIPDNKVLKITSDKSEANNAIKIKGRKNNHLADVYDVYKLPKPYDKFYLIILERLNRKGIKPLYFASHSDWNSLDEDEGYLDDALHAYYLDGKSYIWGDYRNRAKLKKRTLWFFVQMLNVLDEIRHVNITSGDWTNPDNLGFKANGNIGFFDMGLGEDASEINEPEITF